MSITGDGVTIRVKMLSAFWAEIPLKDGEAKRVIQTRIEDGDGNTDECIVWASDDLVKYGLPDDVGRPELDVALDLMGDIGVTDLEEFSDIEGKAASVYASVKAGKQRLKLQVGGGPVPIALDNVRAFLRGRAKETAEADDDLDLGDKV